MKRYKYVKPPMGGGNITIGKIVLREEDLGKEIETSFDLTENIHFEKTPAEKELEAIEEEEKATLNVKRFKPQVDKQKKPEAVKKPPDGKKNPRAIYCIGDCHFYVIRRRLPKNANTNWSRTGSYVRFLYDSNRKAGLMVKGFGKWAKGRQWNEKDCIIICLGGNDFSTEYRKRKGEGNYTWLKLYDDWLVIYDRWLTEFIDPIPINKDRKALMTLWLQCGPPIHGLYLKFNEGLRELAKKHGYRIFDKVDDLSRLGGGHAIHLKPKAGTILEKAFKQWGWV